MSRQRFEVRVGPEQAESRFLVSGFSLKGGYPTCRYVANEAVLELPVWRGREADVALMLGGPEDLEQVVEIFVLRPAGEAGQRLIQAPLPRGGRQEVRFALPAAMIGGVDAVRVLLRFRHERLEPWSARSADFFGFAVEADAPEPMVLEQPVEPMQAYRVFWGDLHVHTRWSECARGEANPEGIDGGSDVENYQFARDELGFDFVSITDHADHFRPGQWEEAQAHAAAAHEDGRFVVLPGYEWTESHLWGHRNVYFPLLPVPLFPHTAVRTSTPRRLWSALEEYGAITIPHHTNRVDFPMDWSVGDRQREPLAEIYSRWGSCEQYRGPLSDWRATFPGGSVQDGLARGHLLGFVGGGDLHEFGGRPQAYRTPHNRTNRGMTAILAHNKTRAELFAALASRRCYATSGARIEVDFRVNGQVMGSLIERSPYEFPQLFPLCLTARVVGTEPIGSLEVICNGTVVYEHLHTVGQEVRFAIPVDLPYVRAERVLEGVPRVVEVRHHPCRFDQYYYLRVRQVDGHVAWSSPIFVRMKKWEA